MSTTRKLVVSALAGALLAVAGSASADPKKFGPGQSGANALQHCHPPGQSGDKPQCK